MYGVILLCSEIRRAKKEAQDNLESYVLGRLGDPLKLGPYVHSHSDIAPVTSGCIFTDCQHFLSSPSKIYMYELNTNEIKNT